MGQGVSDVTAILNNREVGAEERIRRILPIVYNELVAIARGQMALERSNHTLHANALVHEAYLRLVRQPAPDWHGRRYFLAAAAEAMRRILIEHACGRNRRKRGGGAARLQLDHILELADGTAKNFLDVVALDEALCRMSEKEPRMAELVRLRYFAGLTNAEAAEVLGVSERTVKNGWAFARSWLAKELG